MRKNKIIRLVGTRGQLLAKLSELTAGESNEKCKIFFIRAAKQFGKVDRKNQKLYVGLIQKIN